jgi:transposase
MALSTTTPSSSLAARLARVVRSPKRSRSNHHASSLTEVDGIGPVLGVRLIGRTGRAARFPSSDAFASYAAFAPIDVSR